MRTALLYFIGFASVSFGFYEFWRDQLVDQNAFMIGGVCLATAAGIQVLRDLWRRLKR
jgi:hypothetical protein